MPKNKLKRFEENRSFPNLVQPVIAYPPADHALKGRWKSDFFKNDNPLVLELGCGRGEYTVGLATRYPGRNFIGIDWKGARLWRGAKTGVEMNATNMGFLRIQIQNINAFFAPGEVDEIWITFPDPQLTKTGERKRLTSPRFLEYYRRMMTKNGIVNLKTDSRPLYDYTVETVDSLKLKTVFKTDDLYKETVDEILSIQTTYERMWLKDGFKICYIRFHINPSNE